MNALLSYLFQSALSLSVLFAVYWLFLRGDTTFRLNRGYLLAAVLFSLLFPLFRIRLETTGPYTTIAVLLEPVMITPEKIAWAAETHMNWLSLATGIYAAGALVLFLRFVIRLGGIVRQMTGYSLPAGQAGMQDNKDRPIVNIDRNHMPFSFFGMVFISREAMESGAAGAILEHEWAHARQLHSADRILMELAVIFQWFNPAVWLAAREMKAIHEYLADETVLQNGISRPAYQRMILDEAMGIRVNDLTNHFNVSLIKKRMIMMTKPRSKNWAKGKVLIALPVLLALMVLLSSGPAGNVAAIPSSAIPAMLVPDPLNGSKFQDKKAQEKQIKFVPVDTSKLVYKVVEQMPAYPGGHEAMVKFLIENVKYPEAAKKKNVQGTVFVSFIVRSSGAITDVKVLRGIGSGCDEEAVRVVSLMPKWTPGQEKGKAVDVMFNLPIKFALGEKKK